MSPLSKYFPGLTRPPLTISQVVLSDMSEPWLPMSGFSSNTLSNPYRRMMNTSGMAFRDHAASMVSPATPSVNPLEGGL